MIGYMIEADGTARMLSRQETDVALGLGLPVFGTLSGAVIHGAVAATAFERPALVEEVMSGRSWLASQSFTPEGLTLSVRICAEDGRLIHPPRHHRGLVTPLPDPEAADRHAGTASWVRCYFGEEASAISPCTSSLHEPVSMLRGCALPCEEDADPDPVLEM